MKFKPKMMEKVEHVTVAHAGASYNPDFDDHQALLRQEHNKEFKKVKSEDSYKAKAKPKSKCCRMGWAATNENEHHVLSLFLALYFLSVFCRLFVAF